MKKPTEYIKEAWAIYTKKENFIFFARIMAVLVIVPTVIGFVTGYFYPADYMKNGDFSNTPMLIGFIIATLLSVFVALWSQTSQYFAILQMGTDEKKVFNLGFKNMGRLFLASLVIGVMVFFGVILLVIPGIILGVWFSFSVFLVLDKNMKIKDALKTSKQMAKGNFWKVLGRSFVFGLFSLVVSMVLTAVPYVGSLVGAFMAPLFMLPFYLLYRDLSISG
jgi:uncharacterized membrane protein